MHRQLLFVFTALLSAIITTIVSSNGDFCHDPDIGGTIQNKDRKFLVIGSPNAGGAGLGNILVFFPAAFYFAAFTGRDIIISDASVVGEMCSIVHCGFPFASHLAHAFPHILSENAIDHAEEVKALDMQRYIEGHKNYDNDTVVRAAGYQPKSDWWVWFNKTVHCVQKLTGCDLGDVPCAERHAFQRLIRGPFKSSLTAKEEERIIGVPTHIKHAILTLPHAYAPRLDMAVHLRTQFQHFELQTNISDPEYLKEVGEWLNSSECSNVFDAMEGRIIEYMKNNRPDLFPENTVGEGGAAVVGEAASAINPSTGRLKKGIQPMYMYLASDNEDVKEAFLEKIGNNTEIQGKLQVMRVETRFIVHVKNLGQMKSATENDGVLDLVFDWYSLSLSNFIFAWRKGHTNMVSTFVHSAQKVSGTTERTDNGSGRGIGTRGQQLTKDRRGNQRFELFWVYTFMEDFQK